MGKTNFFQPMTNLRMCQKGLCYSGIKIYNNLLLDIKKLSGNVKLFKEVLKKLLIKESYYTVGRIFLLYNKIILTIWIYSKKSIL
jgi:hypothetical protein